MKANFFSLLFLLFPLASFASPLSDLRDLYDSTYSRDNSYCRYAGMSFELQIRSTDRYSQPDDRDYGEYPFIIQKGVRYQVDFSQNIGRYRFIYSKERECSKTLTLPLNKDEITLFYATDSRPRPDTLVLVHYNPKTRNARIVHTKEPIKQYFQMGSRLYFASYWPETQMSTIDFAGAQYNYLRSSLPIWKRYESNQITPVLEETFNQFEWKSFFRNVQEFQEQFQWKPQEERFEKNYFEVIFNYRLQKRCVRVLGEWRCRSFSSL